MTARIFVKLLLGLLLVLIVAMAGVDWFATKIAQDSYTENLAREMAEKARMTAIALGASPGEAAFRNAKGMADAVGARLTVAAADGGVLYDTQADARTMDNHRSRPEFSQSLGGRTGSSIRKSATTGVPYLYVAVPAEGGAAVRLAVPMSQVSTQVDSIRLRMVGVTVLAFLPAVLIAAVIARRMSKQMSRIISFAGELAKGNFRARLEPEGRGELGTLGRRLNEAGEHLQRTIEQLEKEHTELERVERVRKDFVINVSHELRTPLASIQGYAETLMDGAIDDQKNRMRFLGIIRQNAERLASLTADLLTLSRIELKRYNFNLATHGLSDLLEEAVDTVRPIGQKKNIRLTLQIDAGEAQVYCDAEAVHQVLINLLDNAMKYTPEGGEITVWARASEGGGFRIGVRDTGIGIPAEDLPRLFERFYRVDKARSRELGGTGLGLAIVKHLVRAQGGDVEVESTVGEGSTFSFTLSSPVHDAVTAS